MKYEFEKELRKRARAEQLDMDFVKNACEIIRRPASDDIHIEHDDTVKLYKHFGLDFATLEALPADLIISGTLPIPDVKIVIGGGVDAIDPGYKISPSNGHRRPTAMEVRVCFTDDVFDAVHNIPEGNTLMCGFVAVNGLGLNLVNVMELGIDYKGTFQVGSLFQLKDGGLSLCEDCDDRKYDAFRKATAAFMSDWYVVQIALLHPQIKQIIGAPKKRPVQTSGKKRKDKKRAVRYVRQHRITTDKVEHIIQASTESGRKINRKTLAWYVIGHYRHYKSGKTVWIHGHWKGALRQMHMNLDGGRDREIAV